MGITKSITILYKTFLLDESEAPLKPKAADSLLRCVCHFSSVLDECKVYYQLITCYFEINADEPQSFPLHIELISTAEI